MNAQSLTNVPKIIHQIIGQKQTDLIRRCLESWKDVVGRGYVLKIWSDRSIMDFINEYHPFAFDAFINSRNHAEASDIARYLIVHTFGGYYVDWDIELLNIDKFLLLTEEFQSGYMLCDPLNGTLASEHFSSKVSDPFLINLTHNIVNLYNSNQRDLIGTPQYSGPYRMRDSLLAHPETDMVLVHVKRVFAYDYREIRNRPDGSIDQPMIHYWAHSWIPSTLSNRSS